ncbi:MAG: hypothetical protein JWN62_3351 [Acidimicrobiales bacterium]|nr:hypothetical protein [Acidimicrobiales bacterium]
MISADDELRATWREAAGTSHPSIEQLLVDRHAEPHRRYHTAEHAAWVVHHVDALGQVMSIDTEHLEEIRVAALFHDIVYDPRSSTNEADSADVADEALIEVGWSATRRARVRTLILATATHDAESPEAEVLLDADLAILGAEPDAYRRYVAGVRFEYEFVDESAWRIGRSTVLRSFLDRAQIYSTPTMAREREAMARSNLATELAELDHSH